MTDDPTPTAEQVATEAIRVACFEAPKATSSTEWRSRIERILSDYRSALRSSPEALADLNGGEWVPRSELERALLALGSLLRWADEHRISRPDEHGHDCFELWCIERDHARILLDREEP